MVNWCELVTVSVSATRSDAREMDPSIVSVANRWPPPRAMEPVVPVKVTVEPVAVSVDAEEVSQEPAMDIVEDPRARTAGRFAAACMAGCSTRGERRGEGDPVGFPRAHCDVLPPRAPPRSRP